MLVQRRLNISACAPAVRGLNRSLLYRVWRLPFSLDTLVGGGGVHKWRMLISRRNNLQKKSQNSAMHLEERVMVSQSVSQLVSQTVSQSAKQQADRNTQFGFFSGRLDYKQRGGQQLSEQATVKW